MAAKRKYKLKAGTFARGQGENTEVYHAKDPRANVVESDVNLAARWPEKFDLMSTEDDEGFSADEPVPGPKEDKPKKEQGQETTITEDELRGMTKQELQQFADDNEIDMSGAKTKEDMINVLLGQ